MLLPGAVGIFALVMASAEAFTLLRRAGAVYLIWWVKTWIEAKIVESDRGGDSRCRTGILARHYCRGAEPEDGCNFLAFTPHLLTQPPMSPGIGTVSVALNAAANVIATHWAATA